MPKLEQISEEKVSQYPDRLLMIVHADLHKWYMSDAFAQSTIKALIETLHKVVFQEITLRGLRHAYVNKLDDKAMYEFPPDHYLQILNNFRVKGNDDLSKAEKLKRWHNAIHNIWMSIKYLRDLAKPNEEIQNAHDVVADQLSHHPIWDELDENWGDVIKHFDPYPRHVEKEEDESSQFTHLSEIVSGFPDSIVLISDAVLKSDNKIYIQPGITGILRNYIYAQMLRVTGAGEKTQIAFPNPRSIYSLQLARPYILDSLLPISLDDHGFHSMYHVSSAFICIVGGIVDNLLSANDADILVKSGIPDWLFQHIASSIILNHPRGNFLHILLDQGLGPVASFEQIYSLILVEHF